MEFITVSSSKIRQVAYQAAQARLYIITKEGMLYEHQHVPAHFWSEMMLATSIGKYYFDNIQATFPYSVRGLPADNEDAA